MSHMFYKVVDDMDHATCWRLGKVLRRGLRVDLGDLTRGRHFEGGEVTVDVETTGEPMELSFTLRQVPVATSQVANLIDKMAPGAVERFPIEVGGIKGQYEALNVVRRVDAIDRERSGCVVWARADGRPDLVGQFRQVLPLVIRSDIRQDAAIFRPIGWEVVLIVSARLKKELEKIGKLGVLFRPLEGGFTAN